jgi:hypothetical protein
MVLKSWSRLNGATCASGIPQQASMVPLRSSWTIESGFWYGVKMTSSIRGAPRQ